MKFNPHDNATEDGVVITEGLEVVVPHLAQELWKVTEDTTSHFFCEAGACQQNHWFVLVSPDGTRIEQDGRRMQAHANTQPAHRRAS